MAAQVEAKSLSSVNHIAAHPPQYPINPLQRHETLCLYISRVPGSRDVILSPFKPQQKSVTGADVANALYYIHLDTPEDTAAQAAARSQQHDGSGGGGRSSMESARRIVRKPLPTSARVSTHQSSPVDYHPAALEAALAQVTTDRPTGLGSGTSTGLDQENVPVGGVAGAEERGESSASPVQVPTTPVPIIRKPLGPREAPTQQQHSPSPPHPLPPPPPYALYAPSLHTPSSPPDGPQHSESQHSPSVSFAEPPSPRLKPALPLRLSNLPPLPSTDLPPTHADVHPTKSPSPPHWQKHLSHYSALPQPPRTAAPMFVPFSLTLIRRDPGTGHQWNIGKVSSFQASTTVTSPGGGSDEDTPAASGFGAGGAYPAIHVHIETSGYARFRDFHIPVAPKLHHPNDGEAAARDMKELAAQMLAAQQQQRDDQRRSLDGGLRPASEENDAEGGFTRHVTMGYGKSWTRNLKEAFNNGRRRSATQAAAPSVDDTAKFTRPTKPIHRRDNSASGASTGGSGGEDAGSNSPGFLQANAAATNNNLHPKGYTFLSPWQGTCDFRTTSNGRSLKCRHTRGTTSQGFNPLVAAQAVRDLASKTTGPPSAHGNGGGGRRRGLSASLVGAGGAGTGVGAGVGVTSNTVPVSELRFNLPAADLFHSKEDRERAAREVKRGLGELLKSPGGYEQVQFDEYGDEIVQEEGEGRAFDWSALGREKAGGGNRGKRAKLGKLLVYDEGIKMLDLVIAANMGIWWTAWERSF